MSFTVRHDKERRLFSLEHEGETAYLSYEERPDGSLDYAHTYTPAEIRGKGIASTIIKAALDHALQNDRKVVPSCPFVAAYVERHQEYRSVLAAGR